MGNKRTNIGTKMLLSAKEGQVLCIGYSSSLRLNPILLLLVCSGGVINYATKAKTTRPYIFGNLNTG
jgi:hypothetical protein